MGWREKRGIAPRHICIRNLALHGMWAKSLGSLSPSFLACKMRIVMPASCVGGEIYIMYKVIWDISQCIVGMQYCYLSLQARVRKKRAEKAVV